MSVQGEEQVWVRLIHDFTGADGSTIVAGSELVVPCTTADALTLAGIAVRLDTTIPASTSATDTTDA